MHTLAVVGVVLGTVIILLVALLRVVRDLLLRSPYVAPELHGDSDPPFQGESSETGQRAGRRTGEFNH